MHSRKNDHVIDWTIKSFRNNVNMLKFANQHFVIKEEPISMIKFDFGRLLQ